jgi:hypothetical protein
VLFTVFVQTEQVVAQIKAAAAAFALKRVQEEKEGEQPEEEEEEEDEKSESDPMALTAGDWEALTSGAKKVVYKRGEAVMREVMHVWFCVFDLDLVLFPFVFEIGLFVG